MVTATYNVHAVEDWSRALVMLVHLLIIATTSPTGSPHVGMGSARADAVGIVEKDGMFLQVCVFVNVPLYSAVSQTMWGVSAAGSN